MFLKFLKIFISYLTCEWPAISSKTIQLIYFVNWLAEIFIWWRLCLFRSLCSFSIHFSQNSSTLLSLSVFHWNHFLQQISRVTSNWSKCKYFNSALICNICVPQKSKRLLHILINKFLNETLIFFLAQVL